MAPARYDLAIAFDRHPFTGQPERGNEAGAGHGLRELTAFAIDRHTYHGHAFDSLDAINIRVHFTGFIPHAVLFPK